MSAATTTATKVAATLATMQQDGVKSLAALHKLFTTIYPFENISFAAIHTKQTLQAAGLENEAMQMDAALYEILDNGGLKLSAPMQEQALTWLRKLAKAKNSPFAWRENAALEEGATVTLASTYAQYDPRNGQNIRMLPVFDVDNGINGESFQYYILAGKIEICG